jgi:hypothetical protein
MADASVRNVRNNNPGNLKHTADDWEGAKAEQSDPVFVQFDTPAYGVRALSKTLITYKNKHNLNTVEKIINRFAPGEENDTKKYISFISNYLGVTPSEIIDVENPNIAKEIIKAIITQEGGKESLNVFESNIDEGLRMSGVLPDKQSFMQSATEFMAPKGNPTRERQMLARALQNG